MKPAKPILTGGAAAAIIAGLAVMLFPKFADLPGTAKNAEDDLARAQDAFANMLTRAPIGRTDLQEFGFSADTVPDSPGTTLLRENEDECAGQGIYWLRQDAPTKLAITAPHRGSDRHTGTLASMLFLETGAQAAAWNSAPRRPNAACAQGIDLARAEHHLFNAFNLAFSSTVPTGTIVQLHGFDAERRSSMPARDAGMIISDGTTNPAHHLLGLSDCLSLAFAPIPVLVYPGDTKELGARSNMQGQLLRAAGFDGFVHLEISADLRASLVADDVMRGKLASCLMESFR